MKISPVCSNWENNGTCQYADKCRFQHPGGGQFGGQDMRIKAQIQRIKTTKIKTCWQFEATGSCDYGAACQFRHGLGFDNTIQGAKALRCFPLYPPMLPHMATGSTVCRNWEQSGTCRFGNRCRFLHSGATMDKDGVKKEAAGEGQQTTGDTRGAMTRGRRVCRTYSTDGTCKFGDACHFRHVEVVYRRPPSVDADAMEKGMLVEKMEKLNRLHPKIITRKMPNIRESNADAIRFLQFNVLAQGLSSPPKYGGFVKSPVEALDWHSVRKFRVLEEILRHDPDVMCLQELDHFDDFMLPALKHFGYDGIFQPKRNAPTLNFGEDKFSDGCAIFWKTSVLRVLEHRTEFYENPDWAGDVWSQNGLLARMARVNSSSEEGEVPGSFIVSCTHLKSAKGEANEKRRTVQLQQLLAALTRMSKEKQPPAEDGEAVGHVEPILILGDFNTEPTERDEGLTAYETVKMSDLSLKSAYTTHLSSDSLVDSMVEGMTSLVTSLWGGGGAEKAADTGVEQEKGPAEEPAYTTCKVREKGEQCRTIDYVWVSREAKVLSRLEIPPLESLPESRLPSFEYPSDHFSLACDIVLPGI